MRLHRFYSNSFTEHSASIDLDSLQSIHLSKVLRLAEGDNVEVFNGRGLVGKFEIRGIARNQTKLFLTSNPMQEAEDSNKTSSIIPVLKKDNLHFMVQKLIEIGVNKIFIYRPDYIDQSIAKKNISKIISKLEDVVVGACKQSGRNFLPQILFIKNLKEIITDKDNFAIDSFIAFDFTGNNNLNNDDIKDDASIGLITGPESGFSKEEKSLLIDKNVSIKLLGNHTLRAETAAIVGLTLARNFLGKL
ncbi:MAG: RsmE family RNA methyltransferase [Gammaproteobacteria bacterium]